MGNHVLIQPHRRDTATSDYPLHKHAKRLGSPSTGSSHFRTCVARNVSNGLLCRVCGRHDMCGRLDVELPLCGVCVCVCILSS